MWSLFTSWKLLIVLIPIWLERSIILNIKTSSQFVKPQLQSFWSISCCFVCRNRSNKSPQTIDIIKQLTENWIFQQVICVVCLVPLVSSRIKHHGWLYWPFFWFLSHIFKFFCHYFWLMQLLKKSTSSRRFYFLKYWSAADSWHKTCLDKNQISWLSTGWSDTHFLQFEAFLWYSFQSKCWIVLFLRSKDNYKEVN